MEKNMKYLTTMMFLMIPATVWAEPAPAPDAMVLVGADTFSSGQANNLGPAIKQTISEFWQVGDCIGPDYSTCDQLRFGISVFAGNTCPTSGSPLYIDTFPDEDGGGDVEDYAQRVHNSGTFCTNYEYRPHDTGLKGVFDAYFPLGSAAAAAAKTSWWQRPHLVLNIIGDVPQTSNAVPGDRVLKTLKQACLNLSGGPGMDLPSVPTWVMLARASTSPTAPFAGLLAGAGGTAACKYDPPDDGDTIKTPIDVCQHVFDGRSDAKIRTELGQGRYECGPGEALHQTGLMDFGNPPGGKGTLPGIECHLIGTQFGNNCNNDNRPTDVLGVFTCIRQMPYECDASGTCEILSADDATIRFCPDGPENPSTCEMLTEADGDIAFIDARRTLFIVNDREKCDISANSITIDSCPLEGSYCTGSGMGRCSIGQYQCINGADVCVQLFAPMPEICNGLDDDCDGVSDNMSTSWNNFSETLPSQYRGLDCSLSDVCRCPDNASDNHAGTDFTSYLANWNPVCECGEGLMAPQESSAGETPADPEADAQTSCSSTSGQGFSAVLVLGLFGLIRRRRA
jgi:MYXO-CTERM domain-containing protein